LYKIGKRQVIYTRRNNINDTKTGNTQNVKHTKQENKGTKNIKKQSQLTL